MFVHEANKYKAFYMLYNSSTIEPVKLILHMWLFLGIGVNECSQTCKDYHHRQQPN